MTQLKICKGQTYPTIATLLETDDEDASSTKTKSSNNQTVKSSNNQTAERNKKDAPSSKGTIEKDSTNRINLEITQMVAKITNQLEVFTDP